MSEQTAAANGAATGVLTARLRSVEAWRRARFRQMVNELDSDATRARIVRGARLYLEVHIRRRALERGVIK